MLDQQTKKRIDDCRNILVGKITDPKSQVEQITIALIYKFMDDMDTEAVEMGGFPTYFVGEYERYSWKNIFSPRIGGDEMLSLYGEGMVKMNLNPSLPQLFRDIFKNAYLPYRDPETLKLFLRTINEFKYDHSERLGDAFEYLLSVLGSQGDAGQFRTPRHIIDFLVNIIDPKKNESMMDPACGTSGFLISGFKHILNANTNTTIGDGLTPDERKKLTNNITGFDISPDMVRLSLVNLFLHGFTNPKVYEYDTLTSEDRWNEYYDVILANPPFMSPKGGIRPHKRFGVESNRAEVLFVDYIMEHLTPNGRAGIVVPEGIIFQSGTAYKSLRKMMVEKYLVGVISLPSGVFQPYSGVKTSILVFDRALSQKTDKIFFGKVENDGFDLGSQRREIEKNDLPIVKKEVSAYLEGLRNGKLVESKKLTYVSKEQILGSNDIGLSYDRYSVKKLISSSYPIFELKELVEFKRGTSITKKDVLDGDVPVIAGGQSPAYYHNEFNRIGETITVSSSGAYSGFVNFFTIPIFASDCFTINPKDKDILITKFLYYILKSRQSDIFSRQVGGGQPHIYPKSFDGFEIPLPPLDVQEEIVREIEQYQKIIDGANQVIDNYFPSIEYLESYEYELLGNVCDFAGGTQPPKETFKYEPEEGFMRLLQIRDYKSDKNIVFIPVTTRHKTCNKDDIMIGRYGPPVFQILKGLEGAYNVALIKCLPNPERLKNDWLYYFLKSNRVQEHIIGLSQRVRQSGVNPSDLKKLTIPLPSLEIQQSIIERIEGESQIIEGNKKLVEIYTQKIQYRINKI